MRKIYTLFLVVILLVLCRIDVLALDPACTQAEQLRLRGLANATQISYQFYEDPVEEVYGFTVTISGFSPDFYVYNAKDGTSFEYQGSSTVSNSAFGTGKTYTLPFYASDSGVCKGYLILTKMLVLPKYNRFSTDPLCVGHENYELCKKFTSLPISSYKDFQQRMKNYLKSLENKKPEEQKPEEPVIEKTIWDLIVDFIFTNYMIFLIAIIISGTTGIIIIEVKRRRSIL